MLIITVYCSVKYKLLVTNSVVENTLQSVEQHENCRMHDTWILLNSFQKNFQSNS